MTPYTITEHKVDHRHYTIPDPVMHNEATEILVAAVDRVGLTSEGWTAYVYEAVENLVATDSSYIIVADSCIELENLIDKQVKELAAIHYQSASEYAIELNSYLSGLKEHGEKSSITDFFNKKDKT